MAEDHAPLVTPSASAPGIAQDVGEDVHVRPHRIPALERRRDPVHDGFELRLEGAKHPIPDDQRAGVVAILILRIHAVMHTMMRRRVEPRFEPAWQAIDLAGVDPELVHEVERIAGGKHLPRQSDHGQRNEEDPAENSVQRALAQCHREVVLLA